MKKWTCLLLMISCFSVQSQEDERRVLTDYMTMEAGTPVILVVSIFPEKANADDFFAKREEAELQANFPDYDVRIIDKPAIVNFSNDAAEIANFSDSENTYELVVFWDGKKESLIKSDPIKVKATEFVSSFTGDKKASSYLKSNQSIFDGIAKRKTLFNPDKDAKTLTQYYVIQLLFNPMVYGPIEFYPLTHQDFSTVKKVAVYAKRGDQPEKKMFVMAFNDQHLVSELHYLAMSDHGSVDFTFTYDGNGLLKKMVNVDNSEEKSVTTHYTYGYDKDRLIEVSDNQISEYSIRNNMLFTDVHHEFIDYAKTFRVESTNEKLEDNCKAFYEDNVKVRTYCPSGFRGESPYVYVNSGFKYDQLARQATSKIEQDGNVLSISNLNHQDNQYRKIGTITLDDKGLTQSTEGNVQKGIKHILRFEYESF